MVESGKIIEGAKKRTKNRSCEAHLVEKEDRVAELGRLPGGECASIASCEKTERVKISSSGNRRTRREEKENDERETRGNAPCTWEGLVQLDILLPSNLRLVPGRHPRVA